MVIGNPHFMCLGGARTRGWERVRSAQAIVTFPAIRCFNAIYIFEKISLIVSMATETKAGLERGEWASRVLRVHPWATSRANAIA